MTVGVLQPTGNRAPQRDARRTRRPSPSTTRRIDPCARGTARSPRGTRRTGQPRRVRTRGPQPRTRSPIRRPRPGRFPRRRGSLRRGMCAAAFSGRALPRCRSPSRGRCRRAPSPSLPIRVRPRRRTDSPASSRARCRAAQPPSARRAQAVSEFPRISATAPSAQRAEAEPDDEHGLRCHPRVRKVTRNDSGDTERNAGDGGDRDAHRRARPLASQRLVRDGAADDGHVHTDVLDGRGIARQRVAIEHHEVGQLADLQAALVGFVEARASRPTSYSRRARWPGSTRSLGAEQGAGAGEAVHCGRHREEGVNGSHGAVTVERPLHARVGDRANGIDSACGARAPRKRSRCRSPQ